MPFTLLWCWIGYQYRQIVSDYHRISNNSYTLLIHTPPSFQGKDTNFHTLIHVKICTRKNEIIILLFVQRKRKHDKMAFLTSRNATKHILWALGVDRTARNTMKVKFTGVPTQSCKLHPSQCRVRLVSIHVPSLHRSSKPRNTLSKCWDFVTKVCPSPLQCLRGISVTDLVYKG